MPYVIKAIDGKFWNRRTRTWVKDMQRAEIYFKYPTNTVNNRDIDCYILKVRVNVVADDRNEILLSNKKRVEAERRMKESRDSFWRKNLQQ